MQNTTGTAAAGRQAILVADDDDAVRRVTRLLLERAGHAVLEARSGSEAVALLESDPERIGLVITDVVMPEMNGIELATAIRARAAELPILFVSGHSRDTLEQRELIPPGSAFLQKPYAASVLDDHLRQLLPPGGGASR